jgi:hypothetical protein
VAPAWDCLPAPHSSAGGSTGHGVLPPPTRHVPWGGWACRSLLQGEFMQQAAEQVGCPRRAGGLVAGHHVGRGRHARGAAQGGNRGVVEQHRLGGQRGLDRLLRVERAEQLEGGSLAAQLCVGGVGGTGRKRLDQGVERVVDEKRTEGSSSGGGCVVGSDGDAERGETQGRKLAATSSSVTSRWLMAGGLTMAVSSGGGMANSPAMCQFV